MDPNATALEAAGQPGMDARAVAEPLSAQYLTFLAAGDTYAMHIEAIKEILEFGDLTSVPLMPPFIRGVINLRGAVVPVIDLAARLGFAPGDTQRRTCIVIVEMPHDGEVYDLGVVVAGVSEVIDLPAQDLEPPPAFGAQIRLDFIEAMVRIQGQFVIVLNLQQVLSIDEVSNLARQHAEPRHHA